MKLITHVLLVLSLSLTSVQFAAAASFEESYKKEVIKKLTNRNMKKGKAVANGSCLDGLNLISKELAELGGEAGFNSVLDSLGILLAATKASDKQAYNKLVKALVYADDPKSDIEALFYLDDETEAACDSYMTYREMVKYAKKK
ncbi:MAG: hypothetical protein ABJN62_12160 [Halioglobus sp.]